MKARNNKNAKMIIRYNSFLNEAESSNDTVKEVQTKLVELKFLQPKIRKKGKDKIWKSSIDGMFGRITSKAISNYQESVGIPKTGQIDADTLKKLGISASGDAVSSIPNVQKDQKPAQPIATPKVESKSHLLFNGNKLSWIENNKEIKSWPAISGRSQYQLFMDPTIWSRRYSIKPDEWSKYKSEGPTPPGSYHLGMEQHKTSDDWKNPQKTLLAVAKQKAELYPAFVKKYGEEDHEFTSDTAISSVSWGNYRYTLQADKGTNTFGRGSMYLHGGSFPGSIGCIDLSTQMNDFQSYYKSWRDKTGQSTIQLIVDYKTFDPNKTINSPAQALTIPDSKLKDSDYWYKTTGKIVKDTLVKNKLSVPIELDDQIEGIHRENVGFKDATNYDKYKKR